MKIRLTTKDITVEQFLKRAFYLAYGASRVVGAGVLRARASVTEDQVWDNVATEGDYPGHVNATKNPRMLSGGVHADYVFGRMMKWGAKSTGDNEIRFSPAEFDPEYQSFADTYKDNHALVDAVMASFNIVNGYEVME